MRWGQKRREREEKKKRGESKLASNHILMCAPPSGPLRGIHGVVIPHAEWFPGLRIQYSRKMITELSQRLDPVYEPIQARHDVVSDGSEEDNCN